MITDSELKQIYAIVEEYGGDKKPTLMAKIKGLLTRKERAIKKRITDQIFEL